MSRQLLVVILIINASCTSNPFDSDEISPSRLTVQGKVDLQGAASPDGAYIWLEGFEIGTRTSSAGAFSLTIPSPSSQPCGGLDAVFKLYSYVDNYTLTGTSLIVRQGEFAPSVGGLGEDGLLKNVLKMQSLLSVDVEVIPAEVSRTTTGFIQVLVHLKAVKDSVQITFPRTSNYLMGVVYLHRFQPDDNIRIINYTEEMVTWWINTDGRVLPAIFDRRPADLQIGAYKIFPYIRIARNDVPQRMLEQIAPPSAGEFERYLSIPFKRKTGILTVTP